MIRLALAVSTVLGVGYIPFAPGTFGSIVGLLLWWALPESPSVQAAAIVALFILGSWSANVAERHFKSTDPSPVVVDEVMGMLITMWLNPGGGLSAALGFFFFRAFDVVKPYPADRLERLHGGVGVMADDAMAAVYANLALRATLAVAARAVGAS